MGTVTVSVGGLGTGFVRPIVPSLRADTTLGSTPFDSGLSNVAMNAGLTFTW